MKTIIHTQRANRSTPREPLRTLNELAATVGLKVYQLNGMFGRSPIDTPKPVLTFGGTYSRKNHVSYYSPKEFKKWWREYNKIFHGGDTNAVQK